MAEVDESKKKDIYRDTPVRLIGYANEVGESFRALIHVNWVRLSYVIASGYVVADTFDKSEKAYKLQYKSKEERRKRVTVAAVDTLIWQAFASVMVPGFTINRICWLSLKVLAKTAPSWPLAIRKWTTTGIGLGSIPFIVHPIDTSVHYVMDSTIRQLYISNKEETK